MLKNNILEDSLIKKTVLDFEFEKENIVVFEEEKLSVYHQDKNMFRRQPSNIIISEVIRRQPGAQEDNQKGILDKTAEAQVLYQKENSQ